MRKIEGVDNERIAVWGWKNFSYIDEDGIEINLQLLGDRFIPGSHLYVITLLSFLYSLLVCCPEILRT